MFKRKPKAEAEQPQDFPIIDGEPVVVEPEPIAVPEPAKALPMCPENYPHLYDTFGNKL